MVLLRLLLLCKQLLQKMKTFIYSMLLYTGSQVSLEYKSIIKFLKPTATVQFFTKVSNLDSVQKSQSIFYQGNYYKQQVIKNNF